MNDTLAPGLTARLEYVVPEARTVPHLLPESGEFAAMPAVLATGYLVGIVECSCMRALDGHLENRPWACTWTSAMRHRRHKGAL